MCLVFNDFDDDIEHAKTHHTHDIMEFHPSILSSIHPHPLDHTIYKTENSFYVKWFEKECQGSHDTISVTEILKNYIVRRHIMDESTSTVVDKGRGRHIHAQIDLFLNGCIGVGHLVPAVRDYYMTNLHGKFIPWRTEMPIRSCEHTRVVGIVDALFTELHNPLDTNGVLYLHLKDWKVSADVKSCIKAYYLQLGIYKYMLEHFYMSSTGFNAWGKSYTSVKIVTSELVVFHPTSDIYTIYNMEEQPQDSIILDLFEQRKKKEK